MTSQQNWPTYLGGGSFSLGWLSGDPKPIHNVCLMCVGWCACLIIHGGEWQMSCELSNCPSCVGGSLMCFPCLLLQHTLRNRFISARGNKNWTLGHRFPVPPRKLRLAFTRLGGARLWFWLMFSGSHPNVSVHQHNHNVVANVDLHLMCCAQFFVTFSLTHALLPASHHTVTHGQMDGYLKR